MKKSKSVKIDKNRNCNKAGNMFETYSQSEIENSVIGKNSEGYFTRGAKYKPNLQIEKNPKEKKKKTLQRRVAKSGVGARQKSITQPTPSSVKKRGKIN